MDEFSSRYDNLYPLQPEYIDYDTAADMNPTIKKQHIAPFDDKRSAGYNSAPPYQTSHDAYLPYPTRYPRINTFSLESTIYQMKKRIDIIFYINIVIVILVAVIIMCAVLTILTNAMIGKRL